MCNARMIHYSKHTPPQNKSSVCSSAFSSAASNCTYSEFLQLLPAEFSNSRWMLEMGQWVNLHGLVSWRCKVIKSWHFLNARSSILRMQCKTTHVGQWMNLNPVGLRTVNPTDSFRKSTTLVCKRHSRSRF